jgi:hypothetical protein
LRVWWIDEGAHGHRAQSQGVLAALARLGHAVESTRISASDRLPGVWRAPARAIVDASRGRLGAAVAHRMSAFARPEGPPPDLILSSGGKSVFANVTLAREAGAPNVFVGDPRPYPPRWFAAVLSPQGSGLRDNLIATAALPTPITPTACADAASARWPGGPPRRCWTLLVGGRSRSHRFTEADFRQLAVGAGALACRFGISWLVATSRRTGEAADRILADRFPAEALAELTLFSRSPEPVVAAYLGAAERVFVTQDSLTMLSEAVASDRPVTALAPARVRLPAGSVVAAVLDRFGELPGFTRLPIAAMLGEAHMPEGTPGTAAQADLDRAVAMALARIGR